jgi:hypothetical protein
MEESVAEQVVERLRAQRIFAHVNRRVGVYNVGIRVVIPDGREAIWDNDGAAGLEAMVLRDGVLVGFVPQIPDSDDLDAEAIAAIISAADYDAPPAPATAPRPASVPAAPTGSAAVPPPAPPEPVPARRGWRDRLRRRD